MNKPRAPQRRAQQAGRAAAMRYGRPEINNGGLWMELSAENAAAYLNGRPELGSRAWQVTPLGGGISNTVLLAESGEVRIVLKQSLPKLRVQEDWYADRSRIRRECEAMRALAPHLPDGAVPHILFEGVENYLFAMEAAPRGARTWKSLLLEGNADEAIAGQIAITLAAMFRVTWRSAEWESKFSDQGVFDQLRLDPYYRFTATKFPGLAEHFFSRVHDARTRRCSLVHGDWSPKNFLVSSNDGPVSNSAVGTGAIRASAVNNSAVMAIDFEVVHYGDPAFDAAFLLNHLLLKCFHQPHWADRYRRLAMRFSEVLMERLPDDALWFESATCRHLGCLLLARIDGKSPAEYIVDDRVKQKVREYASRVIAEPPRSIRMIFEEAPL
jgi:5-methylthioribose kinase